MTSGRSNSSPTAEAFADAAASAQPSKRAKAPTPFSLRLSAAERALLKQRAESRSVSAYVREQLFGEAASPRKRALRQPKTDEAALARVLAALGQSKLSSNLNQIAKAANMGALPVSPELEKELFAAVNELRALREVILRGLGMRSP